MARHGYSLDSTALYATLLPISLLLNPATALAFGLLAPLTNTHARVWLRELIETSLSRIKLRKIVTS